MTEVEVWAESGSGVRGWLVAFGGVAGETVLQKMRALLLGGEASAGDGDRWRHGVIDLAGGDERCNVGGRDGRVELGLARRKTLDDFDRRQGHR